MYVIKNKCVIIALCHSGTTQVANMQIYIYLGANDYALLHLHLSDLDRKCIQRESQVIQKHQCVCVRVCAHVGRSVDGVKPVIVPISVCPRRPEGAGINRCFSLFTPILPRSLAPACMCVLFVSLCARVCVCVLKNIAGNKLFVIYLFGN